MKLTKKELYEIIQEEYYNIIYEDKNPCWKGYEMIGMKDKGGKHFGFSVIKFLISKTPPKRTITVQLYS